MSVTSEFLFDLASPYSYLAATQLGGLIERTGCELKLTPITISGVFKTLGLPPLPHAPRLAYMRRDLEAWTKKYGAPLSFPAAFPTSCIQALRVLVALPDGEPRASATHALFHAFWGEGRDISKPEVLAAVLDGLGMDSAALLARTSTQEIKDELRANTDGAIQRGLFGVPTFFVGAEMFWGNDRLEFVEAAVRHVKLHA